MATLTVWQFATSDGAGLAAPILEPFDIDDAALVEWEAGARKPRTRPLSGPVSNGALGVGFWGLLLGLVFFVPLLGAEIGAATGALAGALADVGIDDHFINRVRDRVTPGTSALFLLTSDDEVDRIRHAFALGSRPELIVTDLDPLHEAALRAVFGD
jgi:uncharacterized membrane protein